MIGPGRAPSEGAEAQLARFDPRAAETPLRAGENGGRTLSRRNIVQRLEKIGHWTGETAPFSLPPEQPGLSTAVFLRAGTGGPAIAAARL